MSTGKGPLPGRRLGVLGWPVAHSLSPRIHGAALEALGLGQEWRYQLLPVPPEVFAETVGALAGVGFVGVNVTVPHKEAALALAVAVGGAGGGGGGRASERTVAIGAANMLSFGEGGSIEADNTDAPGFLAALPEGFDPAGCSAVVLGAGGSARAVVWALLEAGAADVAVWNRTGERAEALVAGLGGRVVPGGSPVPGADLLVNCTSVGRGEMADSFKWLPVTADGLSAYQCIVDLVYRPGDTALLAAARARGIAVVEGLEVLVAQGALSLEGWTGRQVPIEVMRAAARQP